MTARFCPKCRQSRTTPIEGLDGAARCACGWQGPETQLTATNRTLHLHPPEDLRFDSDTSWCGWFGVELTDVLEHARCKPCRAKARPARERIMAPRSAIAGTLHMERMRLTGEGLDVKPTLCGTSGATTNDPGLVRCRRCRRAMDLEAVSEPIAPVDPSADPLPFEPGPPVHVTELGGATSIASHFARIIERSLGGDDESDRPRWRTLEAAIAKTTAIKQGRSPMRSGFRIEQESRSEGAVRTEDGRDDVIEIDRAFAKSFTRPISITIGLHSLQLDAAVARFLLERVLRGEVSASDVAAELVAAGVYANRELVARMIQDGKAAMRALLEAKGLIERKRAPIVDRDTKPENANGEGQDMAGRWDLEGWKAIGEAIGRGEGAAKRYAEREHDPLPVHEQLGRIVAERREVEIWLSRQTISKSA